MVKILGRATREGTNRYQEQYQEKCHAEHFQETNEFITSSIGIGTYLGEADPQTDALVTRAVIESVFHGVNLIDSAISYRYQQGERSVAQAIHHLINSGKVSRDELIICSKAGAIAENTPQYLNWFSQHYINSISSKISPGDLIKNYSNYYCIHPEYLRDQINLSLENLELETIDIYYVHNPEKQLIQIGRETLYERLEAAFEVIEDQVSQGKIGAYGVATWDGFRVLPDSQEHINLERIKSIAQKVAGNKPDSFKFIQFPLNLAMPEAILTPTQKVGNETMTLLKACARLNIHPISSASIYRGAIEGKIPGTMSAILGENLTTDCQRALQYVRSTPGLLSALVGMKSPDHVAENLSVANHSLLEPEQFMKLNDSVLEISNNVNNNNWTLNLSNLYSSVTEFLKSLVK
ncbi:MAG: aldo/keto reductase [Cyanobacteria bacterium J06621_8]